MLLSDSLRSRGSAMKIERYQIIIFSLRDISFQWNYLFKMSLFGLIIYI